METARPIAYHWDQFVYDEQEAALIDSASNCDTGNLEASTLRQVIKRE